MRSTIRRTLLIVAVSAAAVAPAIVAASPAWATGTMCETSGDQCVGSTGLDYGDHVNEVNSPGRTMDWSPDGGTYTIGGTSYATGTLVFTGGSDKCAQQVGNGPFVVNVGHCSGVTGNVWYRISDGGGVDFFGNRNVSNIQGAKWVLAGFNSNGSHFIVDLKGSGTFQRFNSP